MKQGMTTPDLPIRRLHRHFLECQAKFDDISLQDLAHSFRVITEIKPQIERLTAGHQFDQYKISKQYRRAIADAPFILTPGGSMVEIEGMKSSAPGLILKALSPDEAKFLSSPNHFWPHKKMGFSAWMAGEVILWRQRLGGEIKSFTRERLIKRVSNYLGASHAFAPEKEETKDEDQLLLWMLGFHALDRPYPYFVLMQIASELLLALGLGGKNCAEPVFKKDSDSSKTPDVT